MKLDYITIWSLLVLNGIKKGITIPYFSDPVI